MEKWLFVLGVAVIVAGTGFCLLYAFAVLGMLYGVKGRNLPFPHLLITLISLFRGMLTPVGKVLLKDEHGAEHAVIALVNRVYKNGYRDVALSERIAILPQCLRDVDCKARIDPRIGIECRECGKCVIGRLKSEFPNLRVFISPGGRFAERVVISERPRAVLGVACANDLYEGVLLCHRRGIAVQGLELLRTGCVETAVDEEKLFELARSGCGDVPSA